MLLNKSQGLVCTVVFRLPGIEFLVVGIEFLAGKALNKCEVIFFLYGAGFLVVLTL